MCQNPDELELLLKMAREQERQLNYLTEKHSTFLIQHPELTPYLRKNTNEQLR